MIEYIKGNLLEAEAEALVNTVNTVGVMGKGIALQFKNRFPHNFKVYKEACKNNRLHTGQLLVVNDGDLMNQKIIVNFPTKEHWRSPSKYEYIATGLKALRKTILKNNIQSIAVPPLGCGNGGLDWYRVRQMIEQELSGLNSRVIVYTPNERIKQVLQKEQVKKEAKLTPARAMLLYLMYHYEILGDQSSLFVANKLAYFLQRSGENMRLKFEAYHYGPYAVQLNHVLAYLNGVYLKGMEQNEIKPFEPLLLNYNKYNEVEKYIQKELKVEQKNRLKQVLQLIQGYESTFSLELLSSVDYVLQHNASTEEEAIKEIGSWSERKKDIFEARYIGIAYKHLKSFNSKLEFNG